MIDGKQPVIVSVSRVILFTFAQAGVRAWCHFYDISIEISLLPSTVPHSDESRIDLDMLSQRALFFLSQEQACNKRVVYNGKLLYAVHPCIDILLHRFSTKNDVTCGAFLAPSQFMA